MNNLISSLSFEEIWRHYDLRIEVHQELIKDLDTWRVSEYVDKALGITTPHGNYSASEHGLGPQILAETRPKSIFDFALELSEVSDPLLIPRVIRDADIPYLKISVGSEMAALLNPERKWVTNIRTIYAQVLMKHSGNFNKANEELSLYRDSMSSFSKAYEIWDDLHSGLRDSLTDLARLGNQAASAQGLNSSDVTFLWADAIANNLYVKYSKLR